MAMTIALYVFAVLFFVVGVSRVVEFSNIGIKTGVKRVLVAAHVVGCALFCGVFVAFARETRPTTLVGALLGASLAILFPVHIYVGIKRRITIRDQSEKSS
jgi:hypothetical protein